MSYIGDALTFITGFLASPFVVSPSTGASGASAEHQRQPAEEGTSYFPKTASSSRRSSISSTSTDSSSVAPPAAGPHEVPHGYQPSPSSGTGLPPPKDELCIDTQLSLAPPKRSLHDSLRRAATEERRRPRADDAETKAQKLAAAKQEMLALAARR
ncbi:hypothetical protein PG987_002254 [Apiospora arundinis]